MFSSTYNKRLVFIAACAGILLFGITLTTLGSILPILTTKYQLNEFEAGGLVSLLPFGILSGSLVFGPLVDRYGYKQLLIITTLLVIASLEGLAFADSLLLLKACVFMIGLGGGVINGATNALVADISPEAKGASLSLLGVFFGIGGLGMPFLLGLMSAHFNYSSILYVVGFSLLGIVAFFISTKFPLPKQMQGFPVKQGISLLKESAILLIGFFLFFQIGVEGLINNWTTTYLQDQRKISPERSLFALSIFVCGMTIARLILGFLLRRISTFMILTISQILSICGDILLWNSHSYIGALGGLLLLGVGLAAGVPVMLGFAGELYRKLSGTAFSILFVLALLGNMLLNYLTGIVAHAYGIRRLPFILLFGMICMIILLSIIKTRMEGKLKK